MGQTGTFQGACGVVVSGAKAGRGRQQRAFVADFWCPLTNFLKNQSESLKHHELRPLNGTPLNGDGQVERGTIAEQLLIIREQPCYYGGAVSPY